MLTRLSVLSQGVQDSLLHALHAADPRNIDQHPALSIELQHRQSLIPVYLDAPLPRFRPVIPPLVQLTAALGAACWLFAVSAGMRGLTIAADVAAAEPLQQLLLGDVD